MREIARKRDRGGEGLIGTAWRAGRREWRLESVEKVLSERFRDKSRTGGKFGTKTKIS